MNIQSFIQKKPVKEKPRIALVYDWVTTEHGGAEQVLKALHDCFPDAPLYTGVYNPQSAKWAKIFRVIPTFLQIIPGAKKHHRLLSLFFPIAYEQCNFDDFDIIISISSAEAKGILTKPHQLHLCYLLTPTRYLYSHKSEYIHTLPFYLKSLAKLALRYLLWWDSVAATRPDFYIPISKLIKKRAMCYFPKSRILEPIYPPFQALTQDTSSTSLQNKHRTKFPLVEIATGAQARLPENYLLSYGRIVAYKKFNLGLEAAAKTLLPLLIIGEGPALNKIKKRAKILTKELRQAGKLNEKQSICYFLPHQPTKALPFFILNAQAVLFPAKEDFGISQAECIASGARVILHHESGAAEVIKSIIKTKSTGYKNIHLIQNQTIDELVSGIMTLVSLPTNATINVNSLTKYDVTSFKKQFVKTVHTVWKEWKDWNTYEST